MCEPAGWIKIHRKMLKWEWYDDINVKTLFIHCLLKANYEDKNWRGAIVKRGSFITSDEHLALETKMSRQEVRTAIGKLISTNEIHKQATNKYTILSVINYDTYQNNSTDQQPTNNQPVTNQQPTTNQPVTTTKEHEERKEYTNTQSGNENILIFTEYIEKNCPNINMHFPNKLNPIQEDKLKIEYGIDLVLNILNRIDNYNGITKYNDLFKTLTSWLNNEPNFNNKSGKIYGNNNSKGGSTQYNQPKSRGATVSERNERFNELLPTIVAIGDKHC